MYTHKLTDHITHKKLSVQNITSVKFKTFELKYSEKYLQQLVLLK